MKIKLVVFDWNGTLLNDTKAVLQAANEIEMPAYGIAPLTLRRLREVHEVPLAKAYERLGVPEETYREKSQLIARAFYARYAELTTGARTRKYARTLIRQLQDQDIAIILLSNHHLEDIHRQLHRLRLETYFTDILANDVIGTAHHTGKQHRLEAYLQDKRYPPSQVVIIGDTPEETHIAHALGIQSVALSGGICSRSRLTAARPDHIISSLDQFLPLYS
jgi:phosphoglycolate phosphatase-like HAD superfamily hydrolase